MNYARFVSRALVIVCAVFSLVACKDDSEPLGVGQQRDPATGVVYTHGKIVELPNGCVVGGLRIRKTGAFLYTAQCPATSAVTTSYTSGKSQQAVITYTPSPRELALQKLSPQDKEALGIKD